VNIHQHETSGIFTDTQTNLRLDVALTQYLNDFSRSQVQHWIKSGYVKLNEQVITSNRHLVAANDHFTLLAIIESDLSWQPEPIDLDIQFEDAHLLIVHKPAGMVTHPAAGHQSGTLVNGILHHVKSQTAVTRGGMIHRLDQGTSGLLIFAKTDQTYQRLVQMMQRREISRHYLAIAHGNIKASGTVDQPVGRHPQLRQKMAIHPMGKKAITHYQISDRFHHRCTLLNIRLETGRTHQIRVHCQWLGHPLIGDQIYGWSAKQLARYPSYIQPALKDFGRPALHAACIELLHPITEQKLTCQVKPPDDFQHLIKQLQK
jgi:23S rRNA pseudouridine1911/1915/1917 synthase